MFRTSWIILRLQLSQSRVCRPNVATLLCLSPAMVCENCICCIKVYGNKSWSGADILASRCLIVMLLSVFIIEQVCVETRSSDHGMTLAARCCALPPPADIDRCLPPAPELQRWCLVMGDYFDPSCASTWVAVGARPRGLRRLYSATAGRM